MIEYDATRTWCPVCRCKLVKINKYDTLSKKVCLKENYHPKAMITQ